MSTSPFTLIDFPYFKNDNIYTGSAGRFRFRIAPLEETLQVCVWYEDVCFEKAKIISEASFEKKADEMDHISNWLNEAYIQFKKENPLG